MGRGTEIYKDLIDELAKMSKSCANATAIKKGMVPGIAAKESGINELLNKLNEHEREILAKFIVESYHDGIYDTLEKLEWLRCCKNMVITIEEETLPLGKFEGIPNDYIGRCSDWIWPDK
ncbi:MAG: hypothetical protein LUK37_27235 [Clostridia bacterium]|nr:hypothetical protein [Clostridia bacterium]